MSPRPPYPGAPVVEVISQFNFDPDSPWDLTVPGRLYDLLQQEFPEKRTVRAVQSTTTVGEQGIQQETQQADRLQFFRPDQTAVVQVGMNVLAVSHLRPYTGWDHFLPVIERALDAYVRVAEPKSLSTLSLRYLNLIEFPDEGRVKIEDYFTFYPAAGPALPQDFAYFLTTIQVLAAEGRDVLQLQMARGQTSHTSVLLELGYQLVRTGAVQLDHWKEFMAQAHEATSTAFEGCITDALRSKFRGS